MIERSLVFHKTTSSPSSGEPLGSAALDYSMSSLAPLLHSLRPTANTNIHIITEKALLLASSMSQEEIEDDTDDRTWYGNRIINVYNVSKEGSLLRRAVSCIVAKVGSLSRAAVSETLVYDAERAVLAFPLQAEGGFLMIAIIDVPRKDIVGSADAASRDALLIVVGIAVACGVLLFAGVHITLLPLSRLAEDMEEVAWMRMENVTKGTSQVRELSSMQNSFNKMVENLLEYKQYLPENLVGESDEVIVDEHLLQTSSVAIMFTDIQGSTRCWEVCPEGMRRSLKIHNQVIRRCLQAHNGYEVKTIGDSFMCAFTDVPSAVACGLDIQRGLLGADWPTELLSMEQCARSEDGMWGGLKVRIGINFGPCDVETSTVTTKRDYFGHTVNKAARLEGICATGAVALDDRVYALFLASASEKTLPTTVPAGKVSLKGIEEDVYVTCLLPGELDGRRSAVLRDVQSRKEQAPLKARKYLATGEESRGSSAGTRTAHFDRIGSHDRERFKERLQRVSSAAVGSVEIRFEGGLVNDREDPVAKMNETVSRILSAVQMTNGSVMAMMGTAVSIGWNVSKGCSAHVEQSMWFVTQVHQACVRSHGVHVFVGLSHGPVLSGNVGMSGQRFMTSAGPCVVLSRLLATSAMELECMCLFASLLQDESPTEAFRLQEDLTRTVDHWQVAEPAQTLHVFEVNAKATMHTDVRVEDVEGVVPSKCWGEEYEEAYEAKDLDKLHKLAVGDAAALNVVSMLRSDTSLRKVINPYLLM